MLHHLTSMNQDLLQQFQAAYRDLDLFPLIEPDMIEKLRVEYGRDVLVRLKQEVDGGAKDGKVVFTGHRGCGKSTLLKQFSNEMQSKYFTVFFSVADSIELSAVTHTNILYATGIMLLSKATKANIPVDPTIKQVLLEWTNQDKKTSEKIIKNGAELEVDLQVVTLKLQREGTFRDEIEKTFERRITDLVLCLDRLAATIQNTMKKPVLVIIDDLDKLGLKAAENIYVDNLKSVFSPAFKMLLTVPIEAARNTDIVASLMSEGIVRIRLFPVLKFYSHSDVRRVGAEPIAKNMAIFEEVVKRRFPVGTIAPDTARKMVLLSGGVMRELVRLGRECCLECMVQCELEPDGTVIQVNDEILAIAVRNLRNDFARLIGDMEEGYPALTQVYDTLKSSPKANFNKLLHGLMVLEYENDAMWYDVHPIVLDLLKREGLVAEE